MSMSKQKIFYKKKNKCKRKMQSKNTKRKNIRNKWSKIPKFIGNTKTGLNKIFVTESIQQSGRYVCTTIYGPILGFICQPHFIFQYMVMYARVSDDKHENVLIPCSCISKEKTCEWWNASGNITLHNCTTAQIQLKQKWDKQGSCQVRTLETTHFE